MLVKLKYIWKINYKTKRKVPFHSHNFHELVYYYNGNGISEFSINKHIDDSTDKNISFVPFSDDKVEQISFSDFNLIHYAPRIIHNEIHQAVPASLICIGFEFECSFHGFSSKIINDADLHFKKLFDQINQLYQEKGEYYIFKIENLISQIMLEIITTYSQTTSVNPELDYILNFIDNYCSPSIRVSDIAKSFGYSAEHFREKFKEYVGIAPKAYISKKMIDRARLLLENNDLELIDISATCGFSDYYHFSSFFKKETGVSPNQYRKSLQPTDLE